MSRVTVILILGIIFSIGPIATVYFAFNLSKVGKNCSSVTSRGWFGNPGGFRLWLYKKDYEQFQTPAWVDKPSTMFCQLTRLPENFFDISKAERRFILIRSAIIQMLVTLLFLIAITN